MYILRLTCCLILSCCAASGLTQEETQPVETQPVETQAAEAKAAETQAAEAQAAEANEKLTEEPGEADRAEAEATEGQSPEQKSPEQKSPEQKSAEQKSAEQKSAEQKSPEQKSPEQKSPAPKPSGSAAGERGELQDDYEAALKLAQLEQRPLLVIFGADWCTWCRKLEKELAAKEATAILSQWIVVKVDVDAEPDLAQAMGVRSLPGLKVLGTGQAVVASKEGYLPLVELQAWLDSTLAEADPTIQRVLFDSGTVKESDLAALIEFLGNKSPNLRIAAQRRLTASRSVTAAALVDTLRNGRLSQQLCALSILQAWQAPVAAIDPWQPNSIDSASVQPLIEWLRDLPTSDAEKGRVEMESLTLDEAAANAWIEKLLTNDAAVRANLMAEATLLGKGLIPAVRMRIANGSELDDWQHVALRELLYRLLVGDKCRLENGSLLVALASLRAETHRTAAEKLLDLATSQDQPLVDELSVDIDPLVREMTVAKLRSLGALRDSELVTRLLADKSPSVRTAVLRELSEYPQDKAIETLIAYIDRETDEDLLVYATKTLGQLGTAAGAEDALCRLAKNERWRVRAAALDAVEQSLESDSGSNYGGDDTEGASAEIARAVAQATRDSDAFVVEKALAILPKLLSKRSAEVIGEFLLEHPERIREIDADVSEYQRDEKFAPLLGHATKWLKSDDPKQVSGATRIIAKLQPAALRGHIARLLESKDSTIRSAAISASVAVLAHTRDEQLEAAENLWRARAEMAEVADPWVEIPLALQSLPPARDQKIAELANAPEVKMPLSDSAPAEPVAALAVVDDFFGSSKPTEPEPEPEPEPEAAVAKAEPQTQLDVSDPFGAVEDLFGSAPQEDAAENEPVQSAIKAPANLTGFRNSPLSSNWLVEWHGGQERNEVAWVKDLQSGIESVLDSDAESPIEVVWGKAALLAAGKSELSESIAQQINSVDGEPAVIPQIEDVLPWMTADSRLAELKRREINWHALEEENVATLLQAATVIDNLDIAEWILQGSSAAKLTDAELVLVHRVLIRALLGARADDVSPYTMDRTVKSFIKPPTQRPESVPGAKRATDWLGAQYQATQDDWTRALLLLTASHVDHFSAARSAVGIVANATEFSLEVRIALAIALSDLGALSDDRAVQWLEHPLLEVKLASARRLLTLSEQFAQEQMKLGIAIAYESDGLLGLWNIRRELPVKALREISQLDRPEAWHAKLMLMSTGEDYALSDLLKDHDGKEYMLPIVCALAKAERTDAEAIAFYTKASEALTAYGEPAQLLTLLRGLSGKEIADLRRKLRLEN